MAARLKSTDVEQFDLEQEAIQEQRRKNLQKHRYLFSSDEEENVNEDEDDDDDDLEFDLPKVRHSSNIEKQIKRNRSDDDGPPTKKPMLVDNETAEQILKRQISVRLSRNTVQNYMQKEAETEKKSEKSNKSTKITEKKPIKMPEPRKIRTRSLISRDEASNESPQNKRKTTQDQEQPNEKRQKPKESKQKSTTTVNNDTEKRTRSGRKVNTKENNNIEPEKTTVSI